MLKNKTWSAFILTQESLVVRGLHTRTTSFEAAAIFEPYEKPCGRGYTAHMA
jgi:hypothetical protein